MAIHNALCVWLVSEEGTTKEEFIDNQRAEGNIYELLDAAMAFFFKHLSLSWTRE